jgi:uncharacterized protein
MPIILASGGRFGHADRAARETNGAPLTDPEPVFAHRASSLCAGVSLDVARFLSADPTAIAQQLRLFVEDLSGERRRDDDSELASWKSSVPALQRLLADPRLHGLWILLEAALPNGLGRVDCALIGRDEQGRDHIVVLELKAWSDAKRPQGPSDMLTPIPPGRRGPEKLAHPSRQASGYRTHLKELLVACHDENRVAVSALAWLYNTHSCARPPFNDAVFSDVLRSAPIYGASQIDDLRSHLWRLAPSPVDGEFLRRLDTSDISPSRPLMERLTSSIADFSGFALTGDQIDVFDRIVNAYDATERRVVIVRGGPGAGKTVVALQLLREFYKRDIPAFYFASSQAIVNAYQSAFHASRSVFANSATFGRSNVPVQIIDEAHRLRDRKQIKRAIESAHLTVFLIDDRQIILPADITGHREIAESAASVCPRDAVVLDLVGDKRCGSEAYIHWLDAALGIPTAPGPRVSSSYRFKIVDSPHDLESRLRLCGGAWRIVAGICWTRSDPTESGELLHDVDVPEFDFRRPWSGDHKKLRGARLYQAALCWATEPEAQCHVGNIYTAQSFEFDYVGVIFGKDLVVRDGVWGAELDHHPRTDVRFYARGAWSRPARARDCLQNIYRVLLTRGRKGCFVFFQDAETRSHFERLLADGGPAK